MKYKIEIPITFPTVCRALGFMLKNKKKDGCNNFTCLVCIFLPTISFLVNYKRILLFHLKMCRKISLCSVQSLLDMNDKRSFVVFQLLQVFVLIEFFWTMHVQSVVVLAIVQPLILFAQQLIKQGLNNNCCKEKMKKSFPYHRWTT